MIWQIDTAALTLSRYVLTKFVLVFFPSPFLDWLAGRSFFLSSLSVFSRPDPLPVSLWDGVMKCFIFFERLSFAWHHYESEGPRVTPNTFCNLSVGYLSYCTAQSRLPEQRPCRAAHIGKNRAVFLSACSDFSLYSLRLFCTVWLRRVTVTAELIWFVCSIDEDLFCCFFCSD